MAWKCSFLVKNTLSLGSSRTFASRWVCTLPSGKSKCVATPQKDREMCFGKSLPQFLERVSLQLTTLQQSAWVWQNKMMTVWDGTPTLQSCPWPFLGCCLHVCLGNQPILASAIVHGDTQQQYNQRWGTKQKLFGFQRRFTPCKDEKMRMENKLMSSWLFSALQGVLVLVLWHKALHGPGREGAQMHSCPSSNGKGSRASLQGFRGSSRERNSDNCAHAEGERGPKSDLMLWVQTDWNQIPWLVFFCLCWYEVLSTIHSWSIPDEGKATIMCILQLGNYLKTYSSPLFIPEPQGSPLLSPNVSLSAQRKASHLIHLRLFRPWRIYLSKAGQRKNNLLTLCVSHICYGERN